MRASQITLVRNNYVIAPVLLVILFGATAAIADIVAEAFTTNSSTNVTITNLKINKPSGVTQGDVMIASIAIHDGSAVATTTAPTGWTQVLRTDNDTSIGIVTYWKAAGASEPADYTWTLSPQTRAEGGITRYSGVDNTDPIDAAAGNFSRSKVATTSPITTTAANEKIVAVYALHVGTTTYANDFFSTPTGMTETYDKSYTAAGPSLASFDMTQAGAGVAPSKSSTISGNPNQQRDWASQQIALRQAAPPPSSPSIVGEIVKANTTSPANSLTVPITVPPTGQNQCLIVIPIAAGGNNDAFEGTGSVMYAGTPMSRIVNIPGLLAGGGTMYYLASPTQGLNNVVLTLDGYIPPEHMDVIAFTLQNCAQSSPIDVTSDIIHTGPPGGTYQSGSITTTADNDLVISWIALSPYSPATNLAVYGDQTTLAIIDAGYWPSFGAGYVAKATAGPQTMSYTWTGVNPNDMFITSIKAAQ